MNSTVLSLELRTEQGQIIWWDHLSSLCRESGRMSRYQWDSLVLCNVKILNIQNWWRNLISLPRSYRRKTRIKLQEKKDLKPNHDSESRTDSDLNKSKGNLLIETLDNSPQINIIILPQVIYKDKDEVKSIVDSAEKIKKINQQEMFEKIEFKESTFDCTLKKWLWTCKNFENWNEDIF